VAVAAASQSKKPDEAALREFIEPLSKVVQEAGATTDNRSKVLDVFLLTGHRFNFDVELQSSSWICGGDPGLVLDRGS
jgi:hypothetical protein